jgi:hypothetical protein
LLHGTRRALFATALAGLVRAALAGWFRVSRAWPAATPLSGGAAAARF